MAFWLLSVSCTVHWGAQIWAAIAAHGRRLSRKREWLLYFTDVTVRVDFSNSR